MRRKGLGVRSRTNTEIVAKGSAPHSSPFTPYEVLWL